MALIPLTFDPNQCGVLSLQQDEDYWIEALKNFDSKSNSHVIQLPALDKLDKNEGKRLCGICWESRPELFIERIFCYYTECRHVCCFECLLRWIFLCDQKQCPICVANEVSHQLKQKLVQRKLPYLKKDQDDSFGYSTANGYVNTESNNRIFFVFNMMNTEENVQAFIDTLHGGFPNKPFFQLKLKPDITFCFKDSFIGERIVEKLSIVCRNCHKNLTALQFGGALEKQKINFKHIKVHLDHHKCCMCKLCFKQSTTFPREDEVFFPEYKLDYHNKHCHIECKLCSFSRAIYYDKAHLVKHCRTQHYMCHVCDSTETFFYSPAFLFEHINAHHFICTDCSQEGNQFTAFLTVKQLITHRQLEHPDKHIKERFKILFRLGKNVQFYEEHPYRNKLDQIDALMRKLYENGLLN